MLYHEELTKISKKSGIYLLYNKKDKLMYVGKSIDLESRIPASAIDKGLVKFKYIPIQNLADMNIMEVAYISKFKPIYNKEFKSAELPTINITLPYDESDMFILREGGGAKMSSEINQRIWGMVIKETIDRFDKEEPCIEDVGWDILSRYLEALLS